MRMCFDGQILNQSSYEVHCVLLRASLLHRVRRFFSELASLGSSYFGPDLGQCECILCIFFWRLCCCSGMWPWRVLHLGYWKPEEQLVLVSGLMLSSS